MPKIITDYVDERAIGSTETYTIATTDWTDASSVDPYKFEATVAETYTIGADTIVELINDNAVSFANHGFAIASVDPAYNTITFYAIAKPDASVTLKVTYKEGA